MIKVSVIYPRNAGTWFDATYYAEQHLTMVKDCLGADCDHVAVQVATDESQPFFAVGELTFASVDVMKSAFSPHSKAFAEDLKNYTDVIPIRQLSTISDI